MGESKLEAELAKCEYNLRKYCHAPKCKDIYRHPQNHDICRDKWGIDTMIAWKMADWICDYLNGDKKVAMEEIVDFGLKMLEQYGGNKND